MNTFPSEQQVVKSILEGIKDAHEKYMAWTNDDVWLNSAPEYMINVFIGQHIAELKKESPTMTIWFEINIDDLADSIEPKDINKFKKDITRNEEDLEKNQKEKIDIVLDEDFKSRVIIEVKNNVYKYGRRSKKDIIRICNALVHESTLEYGIFAFFTADTTVDIQPIIKTLQKDVQETIIEIGKEALISLDIKVEDIKSEEKDGSCAAVCFILKRK